VFDGWTLDPQQLLIAVGLAIGGAVLFYFLWGELRHRARRYGGDDRAAAIMLGAVALLLVTLWPNLFPMEVGIIVLVVALGAIYRPEAVIKALGGPNIRWRALHAGRELQVLVAERGGPTAAGDPEIEERVAALADLESPDTSEYLDLLRQVLVADPEAPGMSLKRAQLAEADAALRASLNARPTWERGLERRLAAVTRAATEPDETSEDTSPS
jgi:hypothetical protein